MIYTSYGYTTVQQYEEIQRYQEQIQKELKKELENQYGGLINIRTRG